MNKVRCCWCGATLPLESLKIEKDGFFCPICKHDKFDPRPEALHLSVLSLKPHILTFAKYHTKEVSVEDENGLQHFERKETGYTLVLPLEFIPVEANIRVKIE